MLSTSRPQTRMADVRSVSSLTPFPSASAIVLHSDGGLKPPSYYGIDRLIRRAAAYSPRSRWIVIAHAYAARSARGSGSRATAASSAERLVAVTAMAQRLGEPMSCQARWASAALRARWRSTLGRRLRSASVSS